MNMTVEQLMARLAKALEDGDCTPTSEVIADVPAFTTSRKTASVRVVNGRVFIYY